jgi:hypothetical protein
VRIDSNRQSLAQTKAVRALERKVGEIAVLSQRREQSLELSLQRQESSIQSLQRSLVDTQRAEARRVFQYVRARRLHKEVEAEVEAAGGMQGQGQGRRHLGRDRSRTADLGGSRHSYSHRERVRVRPASAMPWARSADRHTHAPSDRQTHLLSTTGTTRSRTGRTPTTSSKDIIHRSHSRGFDDDLNLSGEDIRHSYDGEERTSTSRDISRGSDRGRRGSGTLLDSMGLHSEKGKEKWLKSKTRSEW